jgi:hypothetical protein
VAAQPVDSRVVPSSAEFSYVCNVCTVSFHLSSDMIKKETQPAVESHLLTNWQHILKSVYIVLNDSRIVNIKLERMWMEAIVS